MIFPHSGIRGLSGCWTKLHRGSAPYHTSHMRATSASTSASAPTSSPESSHSFQQLDQARDLLLGRFVIPAAEVQALLTSSNLSMPDFLRSLIVGATRLARPPISSFHVGAVGLGSSGAVYVGVNLEFPKSALNCSVHAEQFLLVNCWQHGERRIEMVAISAAPCGHCRQFYSEISNSDDVQFLFGEDKTPKLLGELLPLRFGPQDLLQPGSPPAPLLLDPQHHNVSPLKARQRRSAFQKRMAGSSASDKEALLSRHESAVTAAYNAAAVAYAPYTSCPSGVTIVTRDGRTFSGSSIESAAYNPSLGPFQAAVVAGVVGGMESLEEIEHVYLAEQSKGPVSQQVGIKSMLQARRPKPTLTVVDFTRVV